MPHSQTTTTAEYSSLSRWLLGEAPPPGADELRAAQLAAYAYTVLPRSDPLPLDAADIRAITRRHGVTRVALVARARELRCERTLNAFLERCDPDAGRLDLAPPAPRVRRRLNRRAIAERGPLGATERWQA